MKRSRSRRGRAKEYSFGALALALLLFFLYEVYPALTQPGGSAAPPPAGTLEVHFIDVGQGDSILIRTETADMLIDAGPNAAAETVVDYLAAQGVETLDCVVGTHPHEDHIGGLDAVIRAFDVEQVLMPRVQADTRTFEDVLDAVAEKGLKITAAEAGQTYALGPARFTVLSPAEEKTYENTNDNSVVLRLEGGGNTFLFTGDAEKPVEEALLAQGVPLAADVLKVGHHGSSTSSSEAFLAAVHPEYAVIQLGAGNDYGHPHQETLAALGSVGAKVWRNDESGTIILRAADGAITIESER